MSGYLSLAVEGIVAQEVGEDTIFPALLEMLRGKWDLTKCCLGWHYGTYHTFVQLCRCMPQM